MRTREIDIGTLLPYNGVLCRENKERTVVMAIDPLGAMQAPPPLEPLVEEVKTHLQRALEELQGGRHCTDAQSSRVEAVCKFFGMARGPGSNGGVYFFPTTAR